MPLGDKPDFHVLDEASKRLLGWSGCRYLPGSFHFQFFVLWNELFLFERTINGAEKGCLGRWQSTRN